MRNDAENLADRLISQLDTLIPFLEISREDVFNLIQNKGRVWFNQSQRSAFPQRYQIYRKQICHSAFLLGFSYFEAFLADLVRQIYLQNPAMLPGEKQLTYKEVLSAQTYQATLNAMIEKELLGLFYKNMEDISGYFQSKLRLTWRVHEKRRVVIASHIRNCIVHNNGRADGCLARISEYRGGEEISLDADKVHQYGLIARTLGRDLYGQSQRRYFGKKRSLPTK